MFWANSNNYYNRNLKDIDPLYEKTIDNSFEIINNKEIDERKNEQNKFLEFHYALGGLMLYKEQYLSLEYFFNYRYLNLDRPK
ncbi:hypothetical protein [Flammeovirga aprica]|uniref:Uncharacterized protein n=1 Tax=Flammeovirga aprica JL-4 TaxID=694437 RepID=A0A7X9XDS6_9BACT|nr:hypothetical protein [Flammeovirga aprica]NME73108.1 hypothetical protein [Flammeovirga aprica JL-4]